MTCLDTWFSVWLNFDTWIWAVFLLIQLTTAVFLVVHGRTDKTFWLAFFVFFVAVAVVDGFIVYLASDGKNPSSEEAAYDELGCPADWSAWMRFETWIWAVFMLIQVTMIIFLLAQGRKDKSFRQAFYIFFVAVTVVDCVLVLWRPPSLDYQLDETIFGTYYESSYVEDPMVEDFMAFKAPIKSINDVTSRFIIPVFTHAQPLFLTAIAANRFTAICSPLKHAAIWSARRVAIVVFAIATCAVLLGAGTSVIIVIHQMVVCSSATSMKKEDLNCVISLSAICCVVCFALNIASITLMIVLRVTGKLRQKAPELRLFIHSLFMFSLQMLVPFQDVVHILDNIELALDDFGIDPFAWDHPHSTEWLARVKGTRQEIPGYGGVFIPGCSLEDPNEEYPLCSTWYRTFIGELCLREIRGNVHPDTKFTVRSLLQTLLAISGSAFLLVISGRVRNAYFKFYFGRLQRKQKQFSSSINVASQTTDSLLRRRYFLKSLTL